MEEKDEKWTMILLKDGISIETDIENTQAEEIIKIIQKGMKRKPHIEEYLDQNAIDQIDVWLKEEEEDN